MRIRVLRLLNPWLRMPPMRIKLLLPLAAVTAALIAPAAGAPPPTEWNRFRGPNGTGVAETTGLPTEFGPTSNVVWKAAVPAGHSSPVLTATHLFLTAHDGDALLVLAFDRATGRE